MDWGAIAAVGCCVFGLVATAAGVIGWAAISKTNKNAEELSSHQAQIDGLQEQMTRRFDAMQHQIDRDNAALDRRFEEFGKRLEEIKGMLLEALRHRRSSDSGNSGRN